MIKVKENIDFFISSFRSKKRATCVRKLVLVAGCWVLVGLMVVSNLNCTGTFSGNAIISLYPPLNPGTINTTAGSLCSGGNPSNIGNILAASGGDGNYTYFWQSSTDCSSWVDIPGSNSNNYNPPTGITQTTCYRRGVKDGCDSIAYSSTKQFTVYTEPVSQTINSNPVITYSCSGTAPVICTAAICAGTNVSATFSGGSTGIPGRIDYTDIYEYSIDGGLNYLFYNPGNSILTAGLTGTDLVRIRTRRVVNYTSLGCDFGKWNETRWTVNPLPVTSLIYHR